ncbi:MAG TPA: hypothetical protein VM582_00165 [Candidatus Thermoplasmatota archaeon]|nr:hypothetical protein [Candidatus Thermoplasmatota archaeon]
MASLDVLDYQAGLDAELARAGLPAAYRRQAVKEARRIVDAMAFRFAVLDERPLPEDLDYLRALEAVKAPAAAAQVLLRRRPVYARVRRRRLTTTYGVLLFLALAIGGLAYVVTSEESVTLAEFSATRSTNHTFVVAENMTRLYVDATVLHPDDAVAGVAIFLNGPEGQVVQLWPSGDARNNYLRRNIAPPTLTPGEWTVLVDFNSGGGSVHLTILGVRPAR